MKKGFISLILGLLIAGSAVADVPDKLTYHFDIKTSRAFDYLALKKYLVVDNKDCLDSDYIILTRKAFKGGDSPLNYNTTLKIQVSPNGTDIIICDFTSYPRGYYHEYDNAITEDGFDFFKQCIDYEIDKLQNYLTTYK